MAPITVTNGLSWNAPARLMYSPTQLAVVGVPMFATVKMKNIALNIGISVVSPR